MSAIADHVELRSQSKAADVLKSVLVGMRSETLCLTSLLNDGKVSCRIRENGMTSIQFLILLDHA